MVEGLCFHWQVPAASAAANDRYARVGGGSSRRMSRVDINTASSSAVRSSFNRSVNTVSSSLATAYTTNIVLAYLKDQPVSAFTTDVTPKSKRWKTPTKSKQELSAAGRNRFDGVVHGESMLELKDDACAELADIQQRKLHFSRLGADLPLEPKQPPSARRLARDDAQSSSGELSTRREAKPAPDSHTPLQQGVWPSSLRRKPASVGGKRSRQRVSRHFVTTHTVDCQHICYAVGWVPTLSQVVTLGICSFSLAVWAAQENGAEEGQVVL